MLEEKIRKTLEKERNILFAYIFGSYARGEARENSDIDIAIYVKRVPKDIFKYESKIASKIEKEIKKQVEVRVLNKLPSLLQSRIMKEGKLVFSKNEKERIKFETFAMSNYLDFSYLMKEYNKIRTKRFKVV